MSHSDIYKQLAVNKLFSSDDLQNIVNSFIFYDAEFIKIKKLKKKIVGEITHYTLSSSDWVLQCGRTNIQSSNCQVCGNYIDDDDSFEDILPQCILCNCDGEYLEEMFIYMFKNKMN
jgi:hypothetical protein